MASRRVLVTGATGYVGSPTLARLVARGFEVHAVARSVPATSQPGVHWHSLDLADTGRVTAILNELKPTHLLHLAWITTPTTFWESRENYAWVHRSIELLQAFADAGGRRVVMAGTCAEYDWQHGLCTENQTPLDSNRPYSACKNALQAMAAAFCRQSGLAFAWGRLFFVYGPGEHPDRLVSSVTRALLERHVANCTTGTQQRDFMYIDDAAGAFAALLDSPVTGPVNIASGHPVRVSEVVDRLAELCDGQALVRPGAVPLPADTPPLVGANVTRLNQEVGWHDEHGLAQGLAATVSWWRDRLPLVEASHGG